MIFLFKKRTIVVDCFTQNAPAYHLFKPDYAVKFYPEWWKSLGRLAPIKNLPPESQLIGMSGPTIKNCPGVMDYYRNGFILPLWCDHLFEIGKINTDYLRVVSSDSIHRNTKHPVEQRGKYLPESRYTHIKLESPWYFKSNKKVNFIWVKPTWNFDNPNEFIQPPAIIEFYYQHATNFNLFFERKQETHQVILKAGIPTGHFIPISDNKIKLQTHEVSEAEFIKIRSATSIRFSFERSYIKYVKMRNKQED
jgi:hypothetical protein